MNDSLYQNIFLDYYYHFICPLHRQIYNGTIVTYLLDGRRCGRSASMIANDVNCVIQIFSTFCWLLLCFSISFPSLTEISWSFIRPHRRIEKNHVNLFHYILATWLWSAKHFYANTIIIYIQSIIYPSIHSHSFIHSFIHWSIQIKCETLAHTLIQVFYFANQQFCVCLWLVCRFVKLVFTIIFWLVWSFPKWTPRHSLLLWIGYMQISIFMGGRW